MVMGVRSGLDAPTMIEVFNAGSGANTATRDKNFPAVLPRTFDYGFAAALWPRIFGCLDEARELGLTLPLRRRGAAGVGGHGRRTGTRGRLHRRHPADRGRRGVTVEG